MSTTTPATTSSRRAYIGAQRNRSYINSNLTSLSTTNSDPFTTESLVKPNTSSTLNHSTRLETADLSNHLTSTSPSDGLKFLQSEQKRENVFLTTFASPTLPLSTSSSFAVFPTQDNSILVTDYKPVALPFSVEEQQNFHHFLHQSQDYSRCQSLNCENKNNQLLLEEKFQQQQESEEGKEDEQSKGKEKLPKQHLSPLTDREKYRQQSPLNFSLNSNKNFDSIVVPERNKPLSSAYSPIETITVDQENNNRSALSTSTSKLLCFSSQHRPTTFTESISSVTPIENSHNKTLPLTLNTFSDQSSTIPTTNFIIEQQQKVNDCQLNNMSGLSTSSLRYSSNSGTSTIVNHPYDQRISDQGNKYVIQLKTDEYVENDFTVTARYTTNQLVIDAKHRDDDSSGGYVHRELHKIFNIPKHIDLSQFIHTYNNETQELTVEMPYFKTANETNRTDSNIIQSVSESTKYASTKVNHYDFQPKSANTNSDVEKILGKDNDRIDSSTSHLVRSLNTAATTSHDSLIARSKPFDFDMFNRSAFRPEIVKSVNGDEQNGRKLVMSLDLSNYDAGDIKVSVKDRELIVQAERKIENGSRKSRTSFYQSTTLPPQADVDKLESNYVDGKLMIEAPYVEQSNAGRKIQLTTQNNDQISQW